MTREGGLDTQAVNHLFGFRLALAEAATRRLFDRQIGKPLGLRPVEFTLLALLLTHGEAGPNQLAAAVHAKAPQVTVLLDRLAQRELVERRRSSTDGRAVRVLLTAKGRALAQRAHRISLTMEESLLDLLSAAERAMLAELLAKLSGAGHPA